MSALRKRRRSQLLRLEASESVGKCFGPLGIAGLAVLALLAGCARPTGDFGRAEYSVVHDEVMPALGRARSEALGFNLADQEREMRDRVWRYLVAPHAYDWFGDVATEFQRMRVSPMSARQRDAGKYYAWLQGTRFASSRVRYARIEEDIIADTVLLPGVFLSICAVLEMDRQRDIASVELSRAGEGAIDVAKRAAENREVIQWFTDSLRHRYASYAYALDRLLVETPHEEAVRVNDRLGELLVPVERAKRADFCGNAGGKDGRRGTAIPSRYVTSAAGDPVFRK